jgi:hypothetical protein
MVLCPGALTMGCKKCPIVKMYADKSVIGDRKPEQADKESE